jgi:ArsR family transcriptional regulator, arsenate/arsenite/antimonite-responsive transcriptional repressor
LAALAARQDHRPEREAMTTLHRSHAIYLLTSINVLAILFPFEGELFVSTTPERPTITIQDQPCCTPPGRPTVDESAAETYAAWFKALADPTRIRILNLLAMSEEPVCVCDITDHFPLGQPTISHHLKVLRDVRFVVAERRGTFMHYRVNYACLAEFPEAARRILNTNS